MRTTRNLLALVIMLLLALPVQAQRSEDSRCEALIEEAMAALDNNCEGLGRNVACYGHNRVDATFWKNRDGLTFSHPADRVPLIDLRAIATAPLDVENQLWGVAMLHAQADLPDMLPGQAVTFLLMGDARLENDVPPEEAVENAVTASGVTTTAANLRSQPTTQANVPASVPAGTALTLVGVNETGDWYQVLMDNGLGRVWIYAGLVNVPDDDQRDRLPVTYGPDIPPRYGPMQAFYFTTGFGAPQCHDAPDALVVHNTELADVTLRINDLDVTIGSTVVFTTVPLSGGDTALVGTLLEGHLQTRLGGMPVRLAEAGGTLAVRLGVNGRILPDALPLDLADPALRGQILSRVQAATGIAMDSGIVTRHLPRPEDLRLDVFRPPALDGSNLPDEILPDDRLPLLSGLGILLADEGSTRLLDGSGLLSPDGDGATVGDGTIINNLTGGDGSLNILPGTCGSCTACRNPDQCILTGEGLCVWDPIRCR